jgi:hypothetical protein
MQHAWGRWEKYIKNFSQKTWKEETALETYRDNIKRDLKETGYDVWIGLLWLGIGTSDGLL